MRTVGIDAISFYTSHYYLDLRELAKKRGTDPDKYTLGLGQEKMAISAPDEDIVTLAANAAAQVLKDVNVDEVNNLFFATESSIDQAKAAGTYVHRLLNLPSNCRVVELKQACYAATCALQMACALVAQNPSKKVLIIASDIARYGLNTTGESSQGCGACAMIISQDPRILAIEPGSGLFSEDVMDFWRPNYSDEAFVDGKYSSMVFLRALEASFNDYSAHTNKNYSQIDYFLFHAPVPKLVEKALKYLSKKNGVVLAEDEVKHRLHEALIYPKAIGNTYTAALYISLCSLLDNENADLTGKRIGFYSYGSGCVAEYFSGIVQPGYQAQLKTIFHQQLLNSRKALTYDEYEKYYAFRLPTDGSEIATDSHTKGEFRLMGIKNHQRQYESLVHLMLQVQQGSKKTVEPQRMATAIAPGKIILSGEYSVLYGCPAIALAVDRYARTTVTPQLSKMVSFNLFSSRYRDSFPIETLRKIKNRLKDNYQLFLKGELNIREVLKTPLELASYTFANFFDHLNAKFANGFDIDTQSDIPVGCGMGSSAAVILSVLRAVAAYFGMQLSDEKYYQLGMDAERMQHGYSSGLDVFTSLHGGCIHFENGKTDRRKTPDFQMFLVNTGTPEVTTGESVSDVKSRFDEDSAIWESFKAVTNEMDQALQENQLTAIQTLMKENHRLLCDIGVAPEKIKQFIAEIEKINCAAKICGAGAVRGDKAGIVLVSAETQEQILSLCQKYQFEPAPLHAAQRGLHII